MQFRAAASVRSVSIRALVAAGVAFCLTGPASAQTAASAPASLMPDLKEVLETLRSENNLPALAGAVLVGPQATRRVAISATGTRTADGDERVTAGDKFHLGSCTKAMTATMLATLIEEGKLSWTTTVGETFPELKDKIKPEHQAVTLEQLLQHRSGLPDDRADIPLIIRMRQLKGPLPEQRRQMVEIAFNHAKATTPGEFAYSNAGYIVAAAMGEKVTGQAWEDLMQERLFKPLGITSAGYGPPGSADEVDQPRGHRNGMAMAPGPMADNAACMGPAGTVHMTMADWLAFGAAHLDGARGRAVKTVDGKEFLKPETFQRLHTPPAGADYAAGWGVSGEGDGRVLSHAGSNSMWMAIIRIVPKRELVMLFATNAVTPGTQPACGELFAAMEEAASP